MQTQDVTEQHTSANAFAECDHVTFGGTREIRRAMAAARTIMGKSDGADRWSPSCRWFKKRDRTETAGWIAATHADGFSIAGWRGSATPVHKRIRRDELANRGTIVAVYDTMPAPSASLQAKRPWEPGTTARLWRATAINGNTTIAALTETIEQLAAEIDGFGEVIRTRFEQDAISMDDTANLVCLLERRTHDSLERLRTKLHRKKDTRRDTPPSTRPTPPPAD